MVLNLGIVEGLPDEEQEKLNNLKHIYDYHKSANRKKNRYYDGKITLGEVNLGIALPKNIFSAISAENSFSTAAASFSLSPMPDIPAGSAETPSKSQPIHRLFSIPISR